MDIVLGRLGWQYVGWGIALGLAVVGCSGSGDAPPPAADPVAEPAVPEAPPGPTPTQLLMRNHSQKALEAQRALIGGDIASARVAMGWLGANDPSQGELPAELRPHLEGMRSAAHSFAGAETFSDAGVSFGAMLTFCGDCHSASHRGPRFPEVAPPEGTELRDRMHKHAWAAERMWEGLVVRDQARYERGARSLSTVVVRVEELPGEPDDPARVQAIADNVRTLAAEGVAAQDWDGRAGAYGRLLATCATCHRVMQVGPVVSAVLHGQPRPTP